MINNEDELNARIYRFPTSAIKENDKKINYYDFITKAENEGCNAALKRIYPRIDMEKLDRFIEETRELTELQKKFYKVYLNARYEKIIIPGYEQVQEQETGLKLE